MGLFEFLMLFCFGFSWPFSIAKSVRAKSAKGKSLGFMLLIELGYVFGIIHKVFFNYNWVIWAYVALFILVGVDIVLYFRNRRLDQEAERAGKLPCALLALFAAGLTLSPAVAAECRVGAGFSVFGIQVADYAAAKGVTLRQAAEAFVRVGVDGFDCDYGDKFIDELIAGGMKPVNFYGDVEFLSPDGGNRQSEAFIAAALKYRVPRIMVLPDEFTGKGDEAEFLQILKGMRRFVQRANAAGLTVTTEDYGYFRTHQNPCGHVAYLKRLLNDIPQLQFTVDSGNLIALEGREAVLEIAKFAADRTCHVHLKDFAQGSVDKHGTRVSVGLGVIPNREIVSMLAQRGYDGWYTLEDLVGDDLVEDAVRQMSVVRHWAKPPSETDAEGFVRFDGRALRSVGEYFIIRFEQPAGVLTNDWFRGVTQWAFTEVRQLPEGSSMIVDGVYSELKEHVSARNWAKLIAQGARNVRVKFVGSDYSLAADGRETAPDGFVSLFNGRDLSGWRGLTKEGGYYLQETRRAMLPERRWELEAQGAKQMREHWSVRDGALFFDGLPGGYNIAAEKQYGNFEVIVDWRLLRVYGDSGFYLRGLPQVQIWDPNCWAGIGSGSLWNNDAESFAPPTCADRPIGDWNRCRIRMIGNRVWAWLNGVQTIDGAILENSRRPGSPIPLIDNFELQCHDDPVAFRNIFIRELPEEDLPDPAKAERAAPIDLLADGLGGWEAVDPSRRMGWSAMDGVLSNYVTDDPGKMLRGGSGGTHLRTKRADFYDFDLSYDVLVGEKCNSGVYLRGRYEIQVNDSHGRQPDCHNMAALYDLITPTASAEKPAGQWQHVDLTIYRRHLTVTLNGIRIIDNRPIPGVTPGAIDGNEFVPGPILLQGDHSNASFRNMILTPIVH